MKTQKAPESFWLNVRLNVDDVTEFSRGMFFRALYEDIWDPIIKRLDFVIQAKWILLFSNGSFKKSTADKRRMLQICKLQTWIKRKTLYLSF